MSGSVNLILPWKHSLRPLQTFCGEKTHDPATVSMKGLQMFYMLRHVSQYDFIYE